MNDILLSSLKCEPIEKDKEIKNNVIIVNN